MSLPAEQIKIFTKNGYEVSVYNPITYDNSIPVVVKCNGLWYQTFVRDEQTKNNILKGKFSILVNKHGFSIIKTL